MASKKMKKEHELELLESVKQAARHIKGEIQDGMRITQIQIVPVSVDEFKPDEIKELRSMLKLTQVNFAKLCNVGESTVQAWEGGTNKPKDATIRLLDMFRSDPALAKKYIEEKRFVINEAN